jgi:hypothetical protein
MAQIHKVFLLLFVHKKKPSSSLAFGTQIATFRLRNFSLANVRAFFDGSRKVFGHIMRRK